MVEVVVNDSPVWKVIHTNPGYIAIHRSVFYGLGETEDEAIEAANRSWAVHSNRDEDADNIQDSIDRDRE